MMDSLIALANAAAGMSLAIVAGWAVLSTRVHDGIVMKIGLIALSLGFGAHTWVVLDGADLVAVTRAQFFINAGVLLVLVGWLTRSRSRRAPRRRASDFVKLDESRRAGEVQP